MESVDVDGQANPQQGALPRADGGLYEFEALELLPAGRWDLLGVGIGLALAVLVVLSSDHPPAPLLGVVVGAGAALGALLQRRDLFDRWAEFVTITAVAAISLLSGADDSPFRLFLVLPIAWSAVTKTMASARRVWVLATLARLVLAAAGGLTPASLGLALLELGLWMMVGAGIWGLRAAVGRTLADLQRSHAVHRALLEGHASGVYVLDGDFRITEVNEALLRLLGWSREEAIGASVLDFVPVSLHADAIEFALRALRGTPLPYESIAIARDGELVPMLVTHARIDHGNGDVGLYGILQDLRGIREERAARVAVQRRFERMAESSSDGMFVVLIDGEAASVEYVNPSLASMLGVASEADVDADLVLGGLDPEEATRLCAHLRTAEPGVPVEFLFRTADGHQRWLEVRDAWHEDAAGRRVGRQGVVRDVTLATHEREALGQALAKHEHAAEELRRTQRMQRTFLQNLSHEVRTPLTIVSGMLATLAGRADRLGEDTSRELLARAGAHAHRLETLLTDLLDVERLDGDAQVRAVPEPVELDAVATEVLGFVPGAAWRTVLEVERVEVLADRHQVERVVLALLDNAVRHAGSAAIHVGVRAVDGYGVLSVDDHGPGLDPAAAEDIFEPFAQGEGSSRAPQPGTGIGLALARRFVEANGGTIHAGNRPEGGACFEVRLPLVLAAPAEASSGPSVGTADVIPTTSNGA